MNRLFCNCKKLKFVNLENCYTRNLTNMHGMFSNCNQLEKIDLHNFDTKKVENMSFMFSNCYNLSYIDISSFNTMNVKDMRYMFVYCYNFMDLNLFNFKARNECNVSCMFLGCNNLTRVDLINFDLKRVITNNSIFYGCVRLVRVNCLYLTPEIFNGKNINLNFSNISSNMVNVYFGCKEINIQVSGNMIIADLIYNYYQQNEFFESRELEFRDQNYRNIPIYSKTEIRDLIDNSFNIELYSSIP